MTTSRDRTGEVWELPNGTSFLVTGPPIDNSVFGLQHPYLLLCKGTPADVERGIIQENKLVGTFEERGWRRLA